MLQPTAQQKHVLPKALSGICAFSRDIVLCQAWKAPAAPKQARAELGRFFPLCCVISLKMQVVCFSSQAGSPWDAWTGVRALWAVLVPLAHAGVGIRVVTEVCSEAQGCPMGCHGVSRHERASMRS